MCRSNININDILGDYSLTLIDTLDTLAILGDVEEFRHAVQLVIENVNFDKNSTVQVFEANIRYLSFIILYAYKYPFLHIFYVIKVS